jgi:hypothetical protein
MPSKTTIEYIRLISTDADQKSKENKETAFKLKLMMIHEAMKTHSRI